MVKAWAEDAPDAVQKGAEPAVDISGMTDIMDIKSVVGYGADPGWWWYAAAAAFLAALVAAWWVLRRRRRPDIAAPEGPATPPEEALAAALAQLEKARPGDRVFYYEISNIYRAYLEARFAVAALEMTSEELSPLLAGLGLPPALIKELRGFMAVSDEIKYAGAAAGRWQRRKHVELMRRLADAGRPTEAETGAEEGG